MPPSSTRLHGRTSRHVRSRFLLSNPLSYSASLHRKRFEPKSVESAFGSSSARCSRVSRMHKRCDLCTQADVPIVDPHAIHAVRLVHGLGLHPLLLCIPPPSWPLSQPLPSPQHLEHAGLSASETLARALPRASSTTARATPGLDDQGQPFTNISARWLEEAGLHDSEICKRMHLAAALVPLRDITTAEKKKEVWLGDKMLRDVLGVRVHLLQSHTSSILRMGDRLLMPTGSTFARCIKLPPSCATLSCKDSKIPPSAWRWACC